MRRKERMANLIINNLSNLNFITKSRRKGNFKLNQINIF